ncbi:ABC transporter permease [Pseudenhygromyxa sp. WMMC2535]|uniref:ABC transporter permease n=1 Tax=Pseudenhygromyxa sp. WMMC2535 TaxID=2712867 RepID=UPI0015522127|nr:FtsX-like permease family protein [Pseudenhygromyxa sp. WMMC2535]NVB38647.1 ABC transporter permease [Pseudenhygromyxa sp. WMMC2535]
MAGPRLPLLAWRNLWRNSRRTAITLFSIAFGVLLATISTGIGDSSYSEMIDYASRLGGGHVVIQHADYADHPSLKSTVRADPQTLAELRERDDVRAVSVRITGGVMLATSANNVGAGVLAMDPALEDETTLGLVEHLVEGEMFATADDPGIILGAKLAENLDVELGKKVVYTVTGKDGEITSGLARVSGILRTGAPEVDSATCLLPIGSLRQTLGYDADEATQIAVFLDSHRQAHAVAAALTGQVELGEQAVALPWDQALPDLAGFITMKETGNMVLQGIITVLIAAGIFNTLFVSVMERLREFGILAAIGFSSLQLFVLIIWESLWVALCGLAAGVVLTAWPYWKLSTEGMDYSAILGEGGAQVSGVTMDPILYVELYPPHALVIAGAIIAATLLAGIYPALRAGRVEPVKVIRIV